MPPRQRHTDLGATRKTHQFKTDLARLTQINITRKHIDILPHQAEQALLHILGILLPQCAVSVVSVDNGEPAFR